MPGFHDPNRVNLRKAVRAALVVPAVFALLVITGNTPSALFGAFGSFAALVFADFGGPLRRRFRAYVVLAFVGGALTALGTAFADTIWPAVVATLVVAFTVAFSGALGGYFASGGTAATLAFVLAVMSPGIEADLGARELGWVLCVLVAGLAAVVLWPVHQRDRVRAAAASVLREAAACLARPATDRDLTTLRAADAALSARVGVVYRPAGSITRERALVALVLATRRLLALVDAVTTADRSPEADTTPEYGHLATRVAESLSDSAELVAREPGAEPADVDALHEARAAHTDALEHWTAAAIPAVGGTGVVARVGAAFPLRRLSLAAVQVAGDAADVTDDDVRTRFDATTTLESTWETLRAHCNVRSVRFRNAARAGLGLALAVYVAKTTSVQHEFWVVLGALAVLRSNALGTGATALQALAGALVGFGLASALMATMGGDDAWLWVVLPVVVFLAAYTPGAVNFVVGQGAFTVFVVVLFNILVPEGWRTGLVRVQDVAIGAGISVVVGALLWPRGARGVARRSFGEMLRAGSAHLALALDVTLHGASDDLDAAAAKVVDARARAVAALEDLALEHGGGRVDREGWGALLVDELLLELAAAGIGRARPGAAVGGCPDAIDALDDEGRVLAQAINRDAELLERDGVRSLTSVAPTLRPVPTALAQCVAVSDDDVHTALSLVWVHEWLALAAEHPS